MEITNIWTIRAILIVYKISVSGPHWLEMKFVKFVINSVLIKRLIIVTIINNSFYWIVSLWWHKIILKKDLLCLEQPWPLRRNIEVNDKFSKSIDQIFPLFIFYMFYAVTTDVQAEKGWFINKKRMILYDY